MTDDNTLNYDAPNNNPLMLNVDSPIMLAATAALSQPAPAMRQMKQEQPSNNSAYHGESQQNLQVVLSIFQFSGVY